jgi:hypothetical protein
MMHLYPVMAPDGKLTVKSSDGPIELLDIVSILGGGVESFDIEEGYVGFFNADAERLGQPQNAKFPSFSGSVLIARPDPTGTIRGLNTRQNRGINVWVRDSLPIRA